MQRLTGCVLATLLLGAVGAPLATADTVVDRTVTASAGDDGTVTASIQVINTGPDAVSLRPVVVPARAGCLPTAEPGSVAAAQVSTIEVTLPDGCFDEQEPKALALDLDGVARASMPATVVEPPADEPTQWWPLWWGLFAGVLMAVGVGLWGWTQREDTEAEESADGSAAEAAGREQAYAAVRAIVDARVAALSAPGLTWKQPLPPRDLSLGAELTQLEAGWSFKDSWVANITVASTALIALLSSADALTAVLGEKPAAALGVMTVTGLVSAAVIGIANTVAKLLGASVAAVTVGGLIASTALVVLGAGLQVATAGLAVAGAAGSWPLGAGAIVLALVVAAVLVLYACRSLGEAIRSGPASALPSVPDDAVTAWAAEADWERLVVAASIHARYTRWLDAPAGLTATSGVPGLEAWSPAAVPPPPRRRSLL
jgi:hypothetical protein